jgi:hypothetical protein
MTYQESFLIIGKAIVSLAIYLTFIGIALV